MGSRNLIPNLYAREASSSIPSLPFLQFLGFICCLSHTVIPYLCVHGEETAGLKLRRLKMNYTCILDAKKKLKSLKYLLSGCSYPYEVYIRNSPDKMTFSFFVRNGPGSIELAEMKNSNCKQKTKEMPGVIWFMSILPSDYRINVCILMWLPRQNQTILVVP
jgi:hypothetical protein